MMEVAKHNRVDNSWVVVNGFVYDVTKLLKTHPGGFNKLFQAAGKDGSHIFCKLLENNELMQRKDTSQWTQDISYLSMRLEK